METKILLNVLVLYLPLPFFWALFDQQGSRWTFQATRMDGDLGFYTIKPDQMQVINPLLILVFIPLYEVVFYPLLNLIGIRRPLQKITLGGIFAGVAFLCSMGVEIYLEPTYPVLPKAGEAQVRIFNGLNCQYSFASDMPTSIPKIIEPNSFFVDLNVVLGADTRSYDFSLTPTSTSCVGSATRKLNLQSETATSYFIKGLSSAPEIDEYTDSPDKSRQGTPLIRVLGNTLTSVNIVFKDKKGEEQYNQLVTSRNLTDIQSDEYEIFVNGNSVVQNQIMKHGGVYTITVKEPSAGSYVRNPKMILL